LFSFESQFKGAIRRRYQHEALEVQRVYVVTDLDGARSARVQESARRFLSGVEALRGARWELVNGAALGSVGALLGALEARRADLIITYRHLRESPRGEGRSLGSYLDSLTQATEAPVLVLPARRAEDEGGRALEGRLQDTDRVMVMTDHLTEDPALVRYGAEFTQVGGELFLTHVEDAAVLSRYLEIISKIPELDDEVAEATIGARLLWEARQFCESAAEVLHQRDRALRVTPLVCLGDPLETYRELLRERAVDLLVADAKAPGRRAMSALAYAATVEFQDTPILLL
jgi:hypothetical protein